jgi:single-strand DNA-binding protein
MSDMNVVVLTGRLTADPELAQVGENSVANFAIAVHDFKGGEEYTNFFDLSAWGKLAETVSTYLTKGRWVSIRGKLRHETWEKDGQKRSRVRVLAQDLQMLPVGPKEAAPEKVAEEVPF